jgi:3-keto-disaccharide hydrolase
MKIHIFMVFLVSLVLARAEVLFNGKDIKGWVQMHGGEWVIEDGVLIGKNGTNWSTNPEKSGSWLRSAKQYGDFVLELEYAINERGNSGVFFRSDTEKNPAFTGYEMQINDDHGRKPTKGSSCGLYDVAAASQNMSKPAGEWNTVKIAAKGQHIEVWVNGEKTVDIQGTRKEKGYIGLQNHDMRSVVKFRNVKVTEQ